MTFFCFLGKIFYIVFVKYFYKWFIPRKHIKSVGLYFSDKPGSRKCAAEHSRQPDRDYKGTYKTHTKGVKDLVISKEDENGRINVGSGNETFFAGGSGMPSFSFEITIRTKFRVDPEILQKAVKKAADRYWNYRLQPKVDESRNIYFVNNSSEPKVFCNNGQRFRLGTEEVAGYLFVTLYTDDSITVRAFHGIADAHGGISFIKTLFYYYLTLSGNNDIKHDDVLTDEIPEEESERVCEYETFGNADADPYYYIVCDNAYCVDEDMSLLDEGRTANYEIELSLTDLISRVKKNKLTITPWLGAVIGRAVFETYDVPEDRTVVSTCPIDGRKLFGVKALTSFGTTVKLPYDKRLNALDIDTAAKIQRALLDLQNTRPYFEKEYAETMETTKQLLQTVIPTIIFGHPNFLNVLRKAPVKSTFTLTNIGSLEFNDDMKRFTEDITLNSVCRTGEVVCLITSFGDRLRIKLAQCFERDAFAEKIAEILTREGIEATVERKPDYLSDILDYEF